MVPRMTIGQNETFRLFLTATQSKAWTVIKIDRLQCHQCTAMQNTFKNGSSLLVCEETTLSSTDQNCTESLICCKMQSLHNYLATCKHLGWETLQNCAHDFHNQQMKCKILITACTTETLPANTTTSQHNCHQYDSKPIRLPANTTVGQHLPTSTTTNQYLCQPIQLPASTTTNQYLCLSIQLPACQEGRAM